MALQLIYTSAPRLLQAGRTGFGTVAKHPAIRGALQSEIERFSQFSRQEGLKPDRVIFQYRVIPISGAVFHVISRLKDAGSDYTGRTNHIAQHVIFSSAEAHTAAVAGVTPADVIFNLNARSFWCDSWHTAPIEFGPAEEIAITSIKPAISLPATYWQGLTGTPASAAILAPGQTAESCWVIYAPGHADELLALLGESLLLHPNPWRISFANEFQPTDRVDEIAWRGIPSDSPVRITAEQSVRPILDLTNPATLLPPVPEFKSIASFGRHQKIESPQGTAGLLTGSLPSSSVPMAGMPSTARIHPVNQTPDEKTTVPLSRQSLKGLKRKTDKNATAKPRSSIAFNLTITVALAAVVLAAGIWFFYVSPKMQKDHKNAQDSYEQAINEFPPTRKAKDFNVQPWKAGEEPSVEDLKIAAGLLKSAILHYENTPYALKDAEALIANQIQNVDLQVKLKNQGALLVEHIFNRDEAIWLVEVQKGNVKKLKELIDCFDKKPELVKLLNDGSQIKLNQFKSFISHWDGREYPAIIDSLHEMKILDGKAVSEVDEQYAKILSSNSDTEKSKLNAITDDKLDYYPILSKRKLFLNSLPIGDESLAKANPSLPPKALDKPLMVGKEKPAELVPLIKWVLLRDSDYATAIANERSESLGLPKNQGETDLSDLLKSVNENLLTHKNLTTGINVAKSLPFYCVLNKNLLPGTAIVNCEKLRTQPINRELIDVSAGASIAIKESLFAFLSSPLIETAEGKKVWFYFQYPGGKEQQVLVKTITAEADLANVKMQLETIDNEIVKQKTPPNLSTEAQADIEKWLGSKGAFNNLNIGQTGYDFESYLETKLKASSNTSLFDLLHTDDSKKLVVDYIKDRLDRFKINKGTSYSKKNNWTHEMSESINPIANKFSASTKISDSFVAATSLMSNAPGDISQLFSNEYLASAKALDDIFDSDKKRKLALQELNAAKNNLSKQIAILSDLSNSGLVFFVKDPNDPEGKRRLIEFRIEQSK